MNQQFLLNLVVMSLAAAGGATIAALLLAALGLSGVWIAGPSAVCGVWASMLSMNQLERARDQQTAEPAAAK